MEPPSRDEHGGTLHTGLIHCTPYLDLQYPPTESVLCDRMRCDGFFDGCIHTSKLTQSGYGMPVMGNLEAFYNVLFRYLPCNIGGDITAAKATNRFLRAEAQTQPPIHKAAAVKTAPSEKEGVGA